MSIEALTDSYLWSFLTFAVPTVAIFMLIVFIHELGHFLVARWFGVKVEAFSIGFGKEIFHFHDRYGTRWRLAWIPLGGYVRFMDDQNGASVPDNDTIASMNDEDRKHSFHAKPLSQRAAVVAAGPIANFLLAIAIFAGMVAISGQDLRVPRIDQVSAASPAAKAGFKAGDMVRRINGSKIDSYEELILAERTNAGTALDFVVERGGRNVSLTATPILKEFVFGTDEKIKVGDLGFVMIIPPWVGVVGAGTAAEAAGLKAGDLIRSIGGKKIARFTDLHGIVGPAAGKKLVVVVERGGRQIQMTVVPQLRLARDGSGKMVKRGLLGINAGKNPSDWSHRSYGPLESVVVGVKKTNLVITQTLGFVYDLFAGRQSTDQLGGVFRIAEYSGKAAKRGFADLVHLAAVLSISIGIINLFPIPILDGGHLMLYGLEAVRGRPLGDKAQEIGFRIGLALILMLMLYVNGNDVLRYWYRFTGNG